VLTGFSHPNYLAEFGAQGQSEVYAKSSLDLAMKEAFRKMRRFLMNIKGLSEDEAIALMSAAVDFGRHPGRGWKLGRSRDPQQAAIPRCALMRKAGGQPK